MGGIDTGGVVISGKAGSGSSNRVYLWHIKLTLTYLLSRGFTGVVTIPLDNSEVKHRDDPCTSKKVHKP